MARRDRNTKPMTPREQRAILERIRNGEGLHTIASTFRRCSSTIRAIADKHGLRSRRKKWTAAEDQLIRKLNANHSAKVIAKRLGRTPTQVYQRAHKLGLQKDPTYIRTQVGLQPGSQVGRASQFPKGHVPANKGLRRPGYSVGRGRMQETQFKKGVRQGVAADLYQPIGAERTSKDGYLERKINDDLPLQKRWRAVHLIMWEEANGPLPQGHAVAFKNGDKTDRRLENFELITRAELMRRNTIHNLPPELKEVIQLKGTLNSVITKKQKKEKANVDRARQ